MARVYATDDDGNRFLRHIKCDGCEATLKPGPDVMTSGWIKRGQDHGPGTDKLEWDYCPACQRDLR